ncbi:MAG TPA: TlpA disulfide reductase family protein [Chitinophagaceae bacterium]|nr:TlpA disulfide reductase family protein [Chitinophagaceae bacterium]
MKRFLLGLFLLPLFTSGQEKAKPFIIEGKLKKVNYHADWVYLQYRAHDDWQTDSVRVKEGKYRFTGTLEEPVLARLRVKYLPNANGEKITPNNKRDLTSIFIEPGKIRISSIDSFSNVSVKGSASHAAYVKMNNSIKPLALKREKLIENWYAANDKKDTDAKKKIEDEIDGVDEEIRIAKGNIFKKNPSSPIAVQILRDFAGWEINADEVQPLFDLLPESFKKYPSAIALKEEVEIAAKTGIGKMALDFTQNDTLDVPVSLSSFRGKYVLIDFWASWCGPCRAENPNVVKTFDKYKDRNFHIIGVSLDRPGQKEKWLKAIHDDHLAWTQVSDLKFWDNEVAKQYGIRAIPQNLLLNPEGVIIAKNLKGEELDEKLGEAIEGKKGF